MARILLFFNHPTQVVFLDLIIAGITDTFRIMVRRKKVLVSGCYDGLHSGHIRFFEKACRFGDLYVSIASQETLRAYKREPITTEKERVYLVGAVRFVKEAFISRGSDSIEFNFLEDFERIKPDYLVVNEDGDTVAKRAFCRERGVEYVVLKRKPKPGLPARSTTALIAEIMQRNDTGK
jgi:cytidyltransferase-like protein